MAIFGKEFLLWMRFVKTGGQKRSGINDLFA
jgi:hypothetical protein